jgi:transcriptional repressor NrdR
MSGVRKACQGRPVDEDSIALLAQKVEETVRAKGAAELPSHDVGLAILGPLRELDQVAYLRFASVYKSFDSLDEFEREITELREATVAREAAAVRHAVAARSSGRAPKINEAKINEAKINEAKLNDAANGRTQ